MKLTIKIIFLQASLIFLFTEVVIGQCTNCRTSLSSPLQASSAIGNKSKATGVVAFASGEFVIASGDYSTGLGRYNNADGDYSFAIGSNLFNSAERSMVIGHGFGYDLADRLSNKHHNSLMIGFNSIYPTLFVSTSNSKFRTGRVGIGNVTEPQAKLHIRADNGEKANIFVEQNDFRVADVMIGNAGHGVRSTDDHGLIFRTEKNYIFNEGAIGIGTYYPKHELEVHGSTFTNQLTLFDRELYNDNIEGWILRSDANGKAYWTDPSDFNDQDWTIKEDNIYRLNGNVGIGTSNPVAQLDLADIYTAGGLNLKIGNDSYLSDIDQEHTLGVYSQNDPELGAVKLGGSGPILFGNDRKLGIGSSSPATTLELNNYIGNGGTVGLCIGNANIFKWFIGMDGDQKHTRDLLIGNLDNLHSGYSSYLVIKQDGNIGIGTNDTYSYKLAVNGAILTEEVTVKIRENWPDYVFNDNYDLLSINQLDNYIKDNGHLPDIPTESDIKKEGLKVGEMERLLLQKVEELTLYIIQQESRISSLELIIDEISY